MWKPLCASTGHLQTTLRGSLRLPAGLHPSYPSQQSPSDQEFCGGLPSLAPPHGPSPRLLPSYSHEHLSSPSRPLGRPLSQPCKGVLRMGI